MANVYDEQFKERVLRHRAFCDPTSGVFISRLVQYLDEYVKQNKELTIALNEARRNQTGIKGS